jgi:hypothetical protein
MFRHNGCRDTMQLNDVIDKDISILGCNVWMSQRSEMGILGHPIYYYKNIEWPLERGNPSTKSINISDQF